MPRKKLTGLFKQTELLLNQEQSIHEATIALISQLSDTDILLNPNVEFTVRELELVIVGKYGLESVASVQAAHSACWPRPLRQKFIGELLDSVGSSLNKDEICHILRICTQTDVQKTEQLTFIGPPTGDCLLCGIPLSTNNPPVTVKYAAASGCVMSKKKVSHSSYILHTCMSFATTFKAHIVSLFKDK